jgi:hypothetical protein
LARGLIKKYPERDNKYQRNKSNSNKPAKNIPIRRFHKVGDKYQESENNFYKEIAPGSIGWQGALCVYFMI